MSLGIDLARWDLVPDGEPIETPSSLLLAVRHNGRPAMLKIARVEEERRGGALMAWWDGDGAARVLARHGDALLLELATGSRSLAAMAVAGQDDEASRILCAVTDATARALLAKPRDVVVLHGDIHHGNVLDGGERGWLAIDPKGLLGERTFDFVNIVRNPDAVVALAPGRLARQVDVLAAASSVDRRRLLDWTLAFAGLSAAWRIIDGEAADFDLAVVRQAKELLHR